MIWSIAHKCVKKQLLNFYSKYTFISWILGYIIYKYILLYNICSIYTLTGHFIRYTLLVPVWTTFAFRTALILRGIDSTMCWKHSSEMLVHIDRIASHSCCRFSDCESPVPPHPKGALLDWNLVTVEAVWVKWIYNNCSSVFQSYALLQLHIWNNSSSKYENVIIIYSHSFCLSKRYDFSSSFEQKIRYF